MHEIFARTLLALSLPEFSTVTIIGFNSPEWLISFFGAVFARCIPAGIYQTNSQETCEYIIRHSESTIVVAQNRELAQKFFKLLEQQQIQKIVIYNDEIGENSYGGRIIPWNSFLSIGNNIPDSLVESRKEKIKPGNCCLLCYTSGTTGMPKAVMISQDNCSWTPKAAAQVRKINNSLNGKVVSYLPLSHIAALYSDGISSIHKGHQVYFAEPTALQGTLMSKIIEVRPNFFFAVPRIWEKIYQVLKQQIELKGAATKSMLSWAQSIGKQESLKQFRGEATNWKFKLAKTLVFDKIKKGLGLDQVIAFGFGAAPLDPHIREFFLSIDICLINGYGMTETTAPQSTTSELKYNPTTQEDYLEVGEPIAGVETRIKKEKETDEDGQICMRGRNVCMGYFKNSEQTSKTFDTEGYLHSGDLGKIDQRNFLFITGRAKELIITAGGQNVPPVRIENEIKKALPCFSNVVVVGDKRHFLTCLVTLIENPPKSGQIQSTASNFLSSKGCTIKRIAEAKNDPNFRAVIMEGLKQANKKAISRAQMVQNFYLLPEDLSLQNGTLTASLKLKRKQILKLYEKQIEQMYANPKL